MNKLTQSLFATLTVFAFAVFFLSPTEVKAQNEPGRVYFGVQGGLAQSSFSGSGTESSGLQGYSAGAHFMYHINEVLSAEMDFLFTRRGADGVNAASGPNVSNAYDLSDADVELTYYDFPLLLKLTAPIEQVNLRAMAGPAISFQTGATINGEEIQRQLQSEARVQNRFLLYDVFGVVGGEIALPVPGLAQSEVAIDGRYSFGLKNVEQTQDMEMKNRSLSGSLIFRFAL